MHKGMMQRQLLGCMKQAQVRSLLRLPCMAVPPTNFGPHVNTEESGYIKVYERDTRGWSKDESIVIGHGNNQGLSVNNGQRIVTDRLSLDGFKPSYITIYGKDSLNSPLNTYAGTISFDLVFGDPSESPVYYLPFAMLVGVGGLVVVLVVFKKRFNPS